MIKLGQKIRDRVTGLEGIAIAKCEYLNGCIQFCLKPEMVEKGKMPEGIYIDDMQLDVIGDGILIPTETNGGPMADTPSDSYRG